MSNAIFVAVVIAVVVAMFVMRTVGKTSPEEAHRLVEAGALLIDVRTPGEFSSGHLPNARNIPVQALGGRTGELGPKDSTIVLYCRSGARSGSAKRVLEANGFTDVHDLGAMSRW